jgi:hypothetical protein
MKLKIFNQILNLDKQVDTFLNETDKLKLDFTETIPVNAFWNLRYLILQDNYTEEGIDWIDWFLFERTKEGIAYDSKGNIICDTEEKLWEYIEENCKINK